MINDGSNENLDRMKIEKVYGSLQKNGFETWLAKNKEEAKEIFFNEILYKNTYKVVSWGDSMTLSSLDLIPFFKNADTYDLIETFGGELSWREQVINRKKALSSDLFLTGTNALTESGQLVNLDMIGNRVSGIAFGPKCVVVFIGINKIVRDIEAAFKRIRDVAAPLNAQRHPELKTPCSITGKCENCCALHRLCNTWMITDKCYPKGRIKVILIEEALGL